MGFVVTQERMQSICNRINSEDSSGVNTVMWFKFTHSLTIPGCLESTSIPLINECKLWVRNALIDLMSN